MIKKFKFYINKFNKDKKIKAKKYLFNYAIRNINSSQSVIIIIYNENIFFGNDDIQKA